MTIEYNKDDCISDLKRVSEDHPDRLITRDFFRQHSELPETEWIRLFGTFREFKREAQIDDTRFTTKYLNQVAKHASKDKLREFSEEKASWEGQYIRPSTRRFQTHLIGSDVHDIHCDPFWRRLFIETAIRSQPEKIVLNGDIFDFPEFSKFTVDPREYRVMERIKWVHEFLQDLREAVPNSEINMIEGNHEYRLLRHLADFDPALQIILSDLHGLKVKDLLALDRFEVNFMARADLSAFTEKDIKNELQKNFLVVNDQVLYHHFPEGKDYGYPGCNGHHHKHLVTTKVSPRFGVFEWHQLGSGHIRRNNYQVTMGEKWSNGFLLAHLDTVNYRTQFEYIDTSAAHCVIGGKFYVRDKEELEFFT